MENSIAPILEQLYNVTEQTRVNSEANATVDHRYKCRYVGRINWHEGGMEFTTYYAFENEFPSKENDSLLIVHSDDFPVQILPTGPDTQQETVFETIADGKAPKD